MSTVSGTAVYNSTMTEEERPVSVIKNNGDEGGNIPTIQTLNMVPQKVIQVDKPSRYYGDKEKINIFIY